MDSPPVNVYSDAISLGQSADSACNTTTRVGRGRVVSVSIRRRPLTRSGAVDVDDVEVRGGGYSLGRSKGGSRFAILTTSVCVSRSRFAVAGCARVANLLLLTQRGCEDQQMTPPFAPPKGISPHRALPRHPHRQRPDRVVSPADGNGYHRSRPRASLCAREKQSADCPNEIA